MEDVRAALEFLSEMKEMTADLPSVMAYLGQSSRDIQFSEEPYPIRSRLAVVTRSGRQLTDKA